MNKPAAIILSVAGYSIAETIILFSLVAPHPLYSPTPYQLILVFGQLILIPGMAALISCALYGPYQSPRRTLAILGKGALAVPLAILCVILPGGFLAWSYDVSRILFAVALPVVTLAVVLGWVFLARKSGNWAVKAEAQRWLSERQAGTCPADRTKRNRSIRFAVCIPTLLVFPIFLFLPETWGIFSHLGQPESGNLSGYKVSIPASWLIVFHREDPDGSSGVSGACGRGIGRGVNPLRYDSVSSWRVATDSYERRQRAKYDPFDDDHSDVLNRTDLTVGGETMACVDYWPTYAWSPNRRESLRIAHVKCLGSGRLYADFDGMRSQLPAFYEMLASIKPR